MGKSEAGRANVKFMVRNLRPVSRVVSSPAPLPSGTGRVKGGL